MKKEGKMTTAELAKQATKIKVSKRLDNMEDTPFFKKKMDKGKEMLSVAGLPKH